jgi:hypothetical protein
MHLLATGIAAILRFPVELDGGEEPEHVDDDDFELNEVRYIGPLREILVL